VRESLGLSSLPTTLSTFNEVYTRLGQKKTKKQTKNIETNFSTMKVNLLNSVKYAEFEYCYIIDCIIIDYYFMYLWYSSLIVLWIFYMY